MAEPIALEVHDLTVRFGGVTAVEHLSLDVLPSRITGLIGPNGAGKTTTFNACTGLNKPTAGRVLLDGHDVSHEPPERRAQRGLGRTFQRFELYDSVSVRENVELGLEARFAGSNPWRHLVCPGADRERIERAASAAIEQCRIGELADRRVSGLSTGQRRLVELARAIAGGFGLLLLDEPSSGLDPAETVEFGGILRDLVEHQGTTIFLVEHDMSLVMTCCARIFVLDFGQLIFEGSPQETQASTTVRKAYLGSGT